MGWKISKKIYDNLHCLFLSNFKIYTNKRAKKSQQSWSEVSKILLNFYGWNMGTFTDLWSVLDISLFYRESNKRNEGWDQLIVGVHLGPVYMEVGDPR